MRTPWSIIILMHYKCEDVRLMNTVFVANSEMMAVDGRKMLFGKSSSSGFNDYSYKRVYRLGVNRLKIYEHYIYRRS